MTVTVYGQPQRLASTPSPTPVIAQAGPAEEAGHTPAPATQPLPARVSAQDFTARIRLLINHVGSASALAQRCGVSEGTVRNWRDGHSDMSRERCIGVAGALGISLLWLVTGEGAMKSGSHTGEASIESIRFSARSETRATPRSRPSAIEPRQLAATLRLLQSYIGLAGGSLDSPQRAEVLSQLYELLGRAGEPRHAERLIAFHTTLSTFLRGNRGALIS